MAKKKTQQAKTFTAAKILEQSFNSALKAELTNKQQHTAGMTHSTTEFSNNSEPYEKDIQETLIYLKKNKKNLPDSLEQTKKAISILHYMQDSAKYGPILQASPEYPELKAKLIALFEKQTTEAELKIEEYEQA
jgi:hypothetical protein